MTAGSANVAAIARVCPQCGRPVPVDALYAGMEVRCPSCGGTVPPGPAEGLAPMTVSPAGRRHYDSLISYAIAFLVYLLLTPALIQLGWLAVGTPGPGPETPIPVAIVDDEPPTIESGSDDLQPMEATTTALPRLPQEEASSPARMEVENIGAPSAGVPETAAGAAFDLGALDTGGSGGSTGMAPGSGGKGIGTGGGGDGGGGTTGIGGGGGSAGFFGVKARGFKFVFVVDYSGSMRGEKLEVTKQELIRSVSALTPNMKFYIIFYDDQFEPMPANDLVAATPQGKTQYLQWASAVSGGGGTDPREAMNLALSLKPDAVFLLSDGGFPDSYADDIRAANPGAKVQIHTIAFYDNHGEAVLQRIATENRGKYRFVPNPAGARPRRIR